MSKPFTCNDLYRHRSLQALAGSAAKQCAAAVTSKALKGKDIYRSMAWRLGPESGAGPVQLTSDQFDAASPSLSPDAERLAFLSARGKGARQQVQLLRLDGGEAMQLTDGDTDPQSIHMWFPDGSALLLTAKVAWAEDELDDTNLKQDRPVVVAFLPYKMDGSGATVGYRTKLVRVDASNGRSADLASGDFDVSDAQLSPDGKRLAFVRSRGGRQRHIMDLWLADADGGNAGRVTSELVSAGGLQWSPDGSLLAFGGSDVEGDSLSHLWLYAPADGSIRKPVGESLQLEGDRIVWHRDGRRLATIATLRGLQPIVVVDLGAGSFSPFRAGLRHVTDLCAYGDRLLFAAATMRRATELYSVQWDEQDERRHSSFNRTWFNRRTRPRVTMRRHDMVDGQGRVEGIDAWLLRPPGKGPFPLLLDLHGGPQSSPLVDFASHVYWYDLCSRGWAILAPLSVGSTGYGKEFAHRLRGHWGEFDLPQHLSILDALQSEGIADNRLACTGKSYGGYLTAWAIGHTGRFKAAVVSAPVANIESHAGTSDTGYYVTPFAMDGELTKTRERSRALSPVACFNRVTTPTLLLQGADDARCPLGQTEELFAALIRSSQAPAKMVVYPGGSHSLSGSGKPSHRVDYHHRLVQWLQQWAG